MRRVAPWASLPVMVRCYSAGLQRQKRSPGATPRPVAVAEPDVFRLSDDDAVSVHTQGAAPAAAEADPLDQVRVEAQRPGSSPDVAATAWRALTTKLAEEGLPADIAAMAQPGDVRLTKEQRLTAWEQRKKEYSVVHRKLLVALESHHTAMDKCHLLAALHDLVIERHLRLRADMYDDILHCFVAAVAELDAAATVSSGAAGATPLLDQAWRCYEYMLDSGTDPTPRHVQHVMALLARVRVPDATVEARSHRLLMKLDALRESPTVYTLQAYFTVCGVNRCMHIAVSRFVDARGRLELIPTPGMCTAVIAGLVSNGQHDRAIQFVGTLGGVPVDEPMLNASLNALRWGSDPLAAFTAHRAMVGSGVTSSLHTVTTLLKAWRAAKGADEADAAAVAAEGAEARRLDSVGDDGSGALQQRSALLAKELLYVVRVMQGGHIRGTPRVLNDIIEYALQVQLQCRRAAPNAAPSAAVSRARAAAARCVLSLERHMKRRGVAVYDDRHAPYRALLDAPLSLGEGAPDQAASTP